MLTITGTVGSNGKYLVSGIQVGKVPDTLLKITFENNTSGTNLELCYGSWEDFEAGTGTRINGSGGPGYRFLTLINAKQLVNKNIYVLRKVGTANSQFTVNVE